MNLRQEGDTMMTFDYKCMRCQERHERQVREDQLRDTYFAPCPVCGFVARRVVPVGGGQDSRAAEDPALSLVTL
jgi:DNA-directed RNA polymerase subunit RPC12/RpoP